MTVVVVRDATHDNIGHLPPGRAAGYTTGSSGVRWTAADSKAHPGWVRIDQDAAASDPTADILDVERGAATSADCPVWAKRALADFHSAKRPGQRRPAIYCSRSSVTDVVNHLTAGGVHSGVGLWIAEWNNSITQATAEVNGTSGPFPVIGRQYFNAGLFDVSVFSVNWLKEVSMSTPPKPVVPVPPGQWKDPSFWEWDDAFQCGTGKDGKFHMFHLIDGQWVKVV